MKKRNNKKGFTIVELVIVIAVIAILAAVLIPTFSGVIARANESAAMQAAKNEYTEYLIEHAEELAGTEDFVVKYVKGSETYWFAVTDCSFVAARMSAAPTKTAEASATSYEADTYVQVEANSNIYKLETIAKPAN